jgi:hypothetical protein
MQIEKSESFKFLHAVNALLTSLEATLKDLTTNRHLEAPMRDTSFNYLMVVRRLVNVFCIAALLLLAAKVNAQVAGTGTIQGTITDASGAVINNANVALIENSTSVKRDTKTDNAGIYVFPNIPIATYSLVVTVPSFKTYERTNIIVEVGSNIAINVAMAIGSADVKVEVRTDSLALETEEPSYKQTIDSNEITEMPLNGRHMTDLLYISGGVSPASGNDATGSKYSYAAIGISVAGGMANSTMWRLDGADNGDYMAGANLPFPFPDAVGQFSVESSSLGAQDGMHAGGMVNVVTRSGTNTYHGSGFEFIRNNFIDATSFYALPCAAGVSPGPSCGKDTLHQDQYGGTIGGPFRIPKLYNGKDKLFFFAGFQYTRSKSESANSFAYVPTSAQLAGDYRVEAGAPVTSGPGSPGTGSVVGTAPNPLCGTKLTQLHDPMTGIPVLGNVYTTAPTVNPISKALLAYFPKIQPLSDGSDVCGHVQYSIPNQNFDKQFITRVDYTIGHKDNLYGRYMLDSYQLPAYFFPTNIFVTTFSGNPEQRVQTETIGEDHIFTSHVVNSAHISALRRLNLRGYNPNDINGCTLSVSITCAVSAGLYFGTGGQDGLNGIGGGTNSLAHFNDNTLAIDDDLTWLLGRHQLVVGGEYVYNQLNISNAYLSNGEFGFGSNYSEYGPYGTQGQAALNGNYCASCSKQLAQLGDGQLDFLEGTMNSWSQSKQQQNAMRGPVPSIYVQDTFHATKQLTLVLGLRWDPFYNPYDVFNRGANFNLADFMSNTHSSVYPTAPAGMLFYGDQGVQRNFSASSPNQWDPNIGFTYDPKGDGKTVLRAGAEYIYDFPNNFTMERNQQNPPFATAVGQTFNTYIPFASPWSAPTLPTNSGPGAITPTSVIGNPFPNGASFVGIPTASTALFPNGGQYIVPVAKFHPSVYAQWTASVQHDFGKGWMATLQYIGSKGNHEAWGTALNPPIFIPGTSSGSAGPNNCDVSINGTNYWLGEFAASAAVPAAGALCSTTGNETQRSMLIMINPAQGNLIGGVNTSQYINDIAISTYEGMVLSVNHRLSSAFSALANYTWSKCLDEADNNGEVSSVYGEINLSPRADYGSCGFDYRNLANFVIVAKSGFHFNNRTENLILNNWEISGLSSIHTGSVFNVTTGSDDDLIGNPGGDRATLIPGQRIYTEVPFRQGSGEANREYLNPAAFQTSGSYYSAWETPTATGPVYGTMSRNELHGPPLINFDCQISRIWVLHDRLNLDTRIEGFNALNHPSFSTPNSTVTSGSFGQVSGTANGARVFQGAVKITF